MASLIFFFSILGFIFIAIAKRSCRYKPAVIPQFIIGALILELAWAHALFNIILMLMALGDAANWSINTVLGFALCAYNAFQLWCIHDRSLQSPKLFEGVFKQQYDAATLSHAKNTRLSLVDRGVSKHQWLKPFRFKTKDMHIHKDIAYGSLAEQRLTIYEPKADHDTPLPVMLYIHGGGWTLDHAERQGLPLRDKLIAAGWLVVSIHYRLSPAAKFPDHLIDCKLALNWLQDNIEEFGGNPEFIITSGNSAGAHLASLLALTQDKYKDIVQPGFEDKTLPAIKGCINLYGVYDFTDKYHHRDQVPIEPFLEKSVMPDSYKENPALWELASPIHQLHDNAPPFFIIHGELDTLAFVEEARSFYKDLQQTSKQINLYAELPCTQHAFDLFYSVHSLATVKAIHQFAEILYYDYLHTEFTD